MTTGPGVLVPMHFYAPDAVQTDADRQTTYAGWRAAIKKAHPDARFEGDKDICQAFSGGKGVGEWEGSYGEVQTRAKADGYVPSYRVKRSSEGGGEPDTFFVQSEDEEVVGDKEFKSRAEAEAYMRQCIARDKARPDSFSVKLDSVVGMVDSIVRKDADTPEWKSRFRDRILQVVTKKDDGYHFESSGKDYGPFKTKDDAVRKYKELDSKLPDR